MTSPPAAALPVRQSVHWLKVRQWQ